MKLFVYSYINCFSLLSNYKFLLTLSVVTLRLGPSKLVMFRLALDTYIFIYYR